MFHVLVRSRGRIGSHRWTQDLRLLMVVLEVVLVLLDLSRDRVDGHAGADTNTRRFV